MLHNTSLVIHAVQSLESEVDNCMERLVFVTVDHFSFLDRLETNDTRNPMFNETSSRDEFTRKYYKHYIMGEQHIIYFLY